ncbi:MAG: tetratricopeptide repeat protein [Acidobacteria bacterium]|nr:tetratricopeptide repeat protein [Acidobacteriota bacterium]
MNIKIFIASSSELSDERNKIHEIFDRLNKCPKNKRFQDDINKHLECCGEVILLFYSKIGRFTFEEYQLALKQNKKVFIYFKNFSPKTKLELKAFEKVIDLKDLLIKEARTNFQDYENIDQFNSIIYHDLNKYLTDRYPNANHDNQLEKKHTGYTNYLIALQTIAVNQKASTSQPIFDKKLPDLDEKQLSNFFSLERVNDAIIDHELETGKTEEKLRGIYLIDENNYFKKGTFLSLGKNIQDVCIDASPAHFFVFDDVKGLNPEINQLIYGNLISQYQTMIRHLKKNLYLIRDIYTDKPEDYDIPEIVFRELLANAFIHREYLSQIPASYIQVELYPDRLEIKNPGNFYDAIDIETLGKVEKSYVRNLEISLVFFLHKFVEKAGKGIKRIQEVLLENGMKPADFKQEKKGNFVTATVFRKKPSAGLNAREQMPSPGKQNVTLLTALPPQIINLIGRTAELKVIEEAMARSDIALLVNGLGGIGKTEICKHFFYAHYREYRYAAWIDCVENIRDSFINALGSDHLLLMNIVPQDTPDTRFNKIIKAISGLHDMFLLVLDNLENPYDANLGEIMALPPNVKILANSRTSIEGFENIPLDFLSIDYCKELFYRYAGSKNDEEYVEKIIEICGRHTLAIELLAKTAQRAALTSKKLFDILKQKGFNLNESVAEGVKTFWHNKKERKRFFDHMITVFDLSGVTDEEIYILVNLSVLPAVFIDIECIGQWLELPTKDTINALVDKGWLQRVENSICMHHVLQEVIRFKEKPSAEICKTLAISLSNELYVEPGENPVLKKDLLKFADSLLRNIDEENRTLAVLSNNLSSRYIDMGQMDRALEFQLKANHIYDSVSDKNHSDLANSYNNLSMIYRGLGEMKKALEFQMKANQIYEQVLDKNHPDLATSYNNLSMIYRELGEMEKALEFQMKANQIYEQVLDKNHPDLATSYTNLSSIYKDMGQLNQALQYQAKALKIGEVVFGRGHPRVAISLNNLGATYHTLGNYEKALEYYEQALTIDVEVFGKEHPNVAIDLNNLALAYDDCGHTGKAIEYYEQALAINEAAYGKEHPDVAVYLNNLGKAWGSLGEQKKTISYCEQALAIWKKIYREPHPQVAIGLNNLGAAYDKLGGQEKAIEYFENALAIDETIYGKEHPDVAVVLNSLGSAYANLGDQRKAIEYYEHAQDIWIKVYGEQHPHVAASLNNLGEAWRKLGNPKKAIKYYEQALIISKKVYGEKHPQVATVLNNLGLAFKDQGDHGKAIKYFEQALTIDEGVYGNEHPDVARELINLGGAYFHMGQKAKARPYIKKAYTIWNKFYGKDHPRTKFAKEGLEKCN